MENLIREIRHGARSLMRDKAFTVTVVLTLAACIAANSATFAIVNAVVLRPLPVPEADNILLMSNRYPKAGVGDLNESAGADYYDRLREVTVFEEQAMFNFTSQTVELGGTPERIPGMTVTPSFFRLLRVAPALGRRFADEEGEIGAEQKIILSYGLWQQMYGGDPAAVGRELRLNGRPYTVVGVMPGGFNFVNPETRFWIPLAFTPEQKAGRHSNNWYHIGRLKSGATLAQAQGQVDALNAANLERFPQWKEILTNAGFHTRVERLQNMVVKDVKGTLYMLWGGAAFVLLIGGLNIANLALVRLTMRRKEFATRLALGAGAAQVIRQFVVENLLVTLAGGVAGIAVGSTILRILPAIGIDRLPRANEIQMDVVATLVGLGMALAVGIAVGCMPWAGALKVNLSSVLVEEGRGGTTAAGTRRIRQALVVAQVAFAFVLLAGAGLLMASFRELLRVNPGFQTENVLTVSTSLPRSRYAGEKELQIFMERSLDVIRRIPGVTAAGATDSIPFRGDYSDSVILAEGYAMESGESLISPRQVTVTPGYFDAMAIPLVRGRYFNERDTREALPAVIVDEQLARKFWKDLDPIGRRMYMPEGPDNVFKTDANTRWLTVVGVVRSIRLENLAGTGGRVGTYYFPFAQSPSRTFTVTLKTRPDAAGVARAVREEMAKLDGELALFDVRMMAERAELSLAPRKSAMLLSMGYGGLAVFLSAIGIYGVLAYYVAQRRREIGIRMALGSTRTGIAGLVLREGMLLAGAGLAAGIAAAAALQELIASEVYGVRTWEPLVIGSVVGLLALIALAASVYPAWRAARVDPMVALRYE